MDRILELDRWLLLKINQDWTNPFFDNFFPLLTDFNKSWLFKWFFLPVFVGCIVYMRRKQAWEILLTLLLSLSLSDLLCARILKPFFQRLRPFPGGLDVTVRTPIFGHESFPSNHASNIVCFAIIMSHYFPQGRWIFFTIALLVCYSRSYVGVHYPADWIAGGLLGSLLAALGIFCARWLRELRKAKV